MLVIDDYAYYCIVVGFYVITYGFFPDHYLILFGLCVITCFVLYANYSLYAYTDFLERSANTKNETLIKICALMVIDEKNYQSYGQIEAVNEKNPSKDDIIQILLNHHVVNNVQDCCQPTDPTPLVTVFNKWTKEYNTSKEIVRYTSVLLTKYLISNRLYSDKWRAFFNKSSEDIRSLERGLHLLKQHSSFAQQFLMANAAEVSSNTQRAARSAQEAADYARFSFWLKK